MSDKCKDCESYKKGIVWPFAPRQNRSSARTIECNGGAIAEHKPCFVPKKKGRK